MAKSRSGSEARLPPPLRPPLLDSWAGPLILRPWFDRLALPAIVRWFFPLSRAWAAAAACEGDLERFSAAAYGPERPGPAPGRLAARFLAKVETHRRRYEAAERAWREAYFEAVGAASATALVAAQNFRRDAAQHFMAARTAAVPLHLARRFAPLRFAVTPPGRLEVQHGARLRDSHAAFALPKIPDIVESRRVPAPWGHEHWLRFEAPVLGDTAWARVSVPARGECRTPSLIFLHGIAMETEFWRRLADPSQPMIERGVRLIRPEGPWHGRRRPPGWFGGEPVMARGPHGFIELFQAWAAEVAALIAWARQTSTGPVAIGGVSLGALAAQMVATAARDWPAALRPDALLLVASSGDLVDVTERGSLSGALGMPARLRAAGWGLEELTRWSPLLQPQGAPGIDPAKIVMVLGQADDLVPYGTGLDLARRWGVPPANLFQRPQGHFSVSLGLGPDPAPLARLAKLLGAA